MTELVGARTFFVDSVAGCDTATGLGEPAAWRSLAPVNAREFQPGDRILFRAGSRFAGELKPRGSGTPEQPIVIDVYGEGSKPRIDGEGQVAQALHLYNVEGWEIRNLELTNHGAERAKDRRGVYLELQNFGEARHIVLKGLHVHHVNGTTEKHKGEGYAIRWQCGGAEKPSRYNGLLIEDCHIQRCERNGIVGGGHFRRDSWYPSLRVVIRRNLIEQIPGDGIVPIACDGVLVEYNRMRDGTPLEPDGEAAAGIWPWSCDNAVIQFNEVSDHKAGWDGQGFDSDFNCRNTVIQYNFSHDNVGGFLLVCDSGDRAYSCGNIGTVVRHNLSVNDGFRGAGKHAGFSPAIHIAGPVRNTRIHGNTIVRTRKMEPGLDARLIAITDWGGWAEDTRIEGNLFHAEGCAPHDLGQSLRTRIVNNSGG